MAQHEIGHSARPDLPLAVVVGVGGMGMAVARRLGQSHRLLLVDVDGHRLEQRMVMLRDEGHDARSVVCDITDRTSVDGLVKGVSDLGPLRVLAHVAGLSPSMADWQTIMRVNLLGPRQVAEALYPLTVQGTAGIFIASLGGHIAPPAAELTALLDEPDMPQFFDRLEQIEGGNIPTSRAYQLSKYALIRFCGRCATRWGGRGARILSLSPGLIATPMGALEFRNQPAKYELLAKTPLGREGTMLEIADAVAFLSSDSASFISGIDLLVDGGLAAALKYGG